MRMAKPGDPMSQVVYFDFSAVAWPKVVTTLCAFRATVESQSAYAYVKAASGLQAQMIDKLARELALEDYICTDTIPPRKFRELSEEHGWRPPFGIQPSTSLSTASQRGHGASLVRRSWMKIVGSPVTAHGTNRRN